MAKRDITELINRYEQKHASGKSVYLDADEFEILAEYYDASSDIDLAREVVEDGLLIHPENSGLLLKQAKFIVYDGEYTKALELMGRYFSEYDFDLYLLRVECFLQLGLDAEAYESVKEILDKEDELGNALAEIGFIYVEADYFKEAALYLRKSLEYDADKLDVLGDLAYCYEMLGDFDAAITTTNSILDLDPYSFEAWVNIGKLYSLQERFDEAVDAFDFALTVNANDINILKLKGHCLSLGGRTEEAIAIFKELLQQKPADTSVYFLIAECYQILDDYDSALRYLREYSKTLGDVVSDEDFLLEENKNNLGVALSIVNQGLDNDPYSQELHIIAGDILFREEKFVEAESYFIKALALGDNSVGVLDRLAVTAIRTEDYEQAVRYTRLILKIEPENANARQRLALLYFELDDNSQFDSLLDELSDSELHSLINLIYSRTVDMDIDRMQLRVLLEEARNCRILFRNLKY